MPESHLPVSDSDRRTSNRIPGVSRQLITRVTAETATVTVLETYHLADRASGVSRMLHNVSWPIEMWEADPVLCCRAALTLIHPALGALRAGDGQ